MYQVGLDSPPFESLFWIKYIRYTFFLKSKSCIIQSVVEANRATMASHTNTILLSGLSMCLSCYVM
jgi:hypothetical protein